MFPPGRMLAFADMAQATDHMLAAHVKGYEVIHRLQPEATVTTNNVSLSLYELDRMLVDVLVARRQGVTRDEVADWLRERRSEWYASLAPAGPLERVLRWTTAAQWERGRASPPRSTPSGPSPHECTLDVLGIDYYDPVVANHVSLPGHRTAGGTSWQAGNDLWDDRVDGAGLVEYCRANVAPGLGLWVVENGLCNRVRRGRSFHASTAGHVLAICRPCWAPSSTPSTRACPSAPITTGRSWTTTSGAATSPGSGSTGSTATGGSRSSTPTPWAPTRPARTGGSSPGSGPATGPCWRRPS